MLFRFWKNAPKFLDEQGENELVIPVDWWKRKPLVQRNAAHHVLCWPTLIDTHSSEFTLIEVLICRMGASRFFLWTRARSVRPVCKIPQDSTRA